MERGSATWLATTVHSLWCEAAKPLCPLCAIDKTGNAGAIQCSDPRQLGCCWQRLGRTLEERKQRTHASAMPLPRYPLTALSSGLSAKAAQHAVVVGQPSCSVHMADHVRCRFPVAHSALRDLAVASGATLATGLGVMVPRGRCCAVEKTGSTAARLSGFPPFLLCSELSVEAKAACNRDCGYTALPHTCHTLQCTVTLSHCHSTRK